MKLDICEKTYTQKELCSEIKYCCVMMKSMVKQDLIDIDIHEYGPEVKLYVDDDRNTGRYFPYEERDKDIIYIHWKVNINYCPFCGEKIE